MGGRMGGAFGKRKTFFCIGGNSERVKCFWMSAMAQGLSPCYTVHTAESLHKAAHTLDLVPPLQP